MHILAIATSKCPVEHKDAVTGVMQWLNAFVGGPHSSNGMLITSSYMYMRILPR